MLGVGGCLRKDDRVSQGGGGMSIFFSDGSRPGCLLTMSSCLTADVGPCPSVLVLVGILSGLADDGTLN